MVRQAPPEASKYLDPGDVRKGMDGKMWIVRETTRGKLHWVREAGSGHTRPKRYTRQYTTSQWFAPIWTRNMTYLRYLASEMNSKIIRLTSGEQVLLYSDLYGQWHAVSLRVPESIPLNEIKILSQITDDHSKAKGKLFVLVNMVLREKTSEARASKISKLVAMNNDDIGSAIETYEKAVSTYHAYTVPKFIQNGDRSCDNYKTLLEAAGGNKNIAFNLFLVNTGARRGVMIDKEEYPTPQDYHTFKTLAQKCANIKITSFGDQCLLTHKSVPSAEIDGAQTSRDAMREMVGFLCDGGDTGFLVGYAVGRRRSKRFIFYAELCGHLTQNLRDRFEERRVEWAKAASEIGERVTLIIRTFNSTESNMEAFVDRDIPLLWSQHETIGQDLIDDSYETTGQMIKTVRSEEELRQMSVRGVLCIWILISCIRYKNVIHDPFVLDGILNPREELAADEAISEMDVNFYPVLKEQPLSGENPDVGHWVSHHASFQDMGFTRTALLMNAVASNWDTIKQNYLILSLMVPIVLALDFFVKSVPRAQRQIHKIMLKASRLENLIDEIFSLNLPTALTPYTSTSTSSVTAAAFTYNPHQE